MFSRTVLATLVRRAQQPPLLQPAGRGFSVSWRRGQRTYPADGGAFWRLRWWSGLEGERYAPSTVMRKRRDRLPTDRVVLFQTGEMYKRTTLLPQPDGWIVRVEVQYAKYLRQRYGEKIFMLRGEAAADFRREIITQAIKHYKLWKKKR